MYQYKLIIYSSLCLLICIFVGKQLQLQLLSIRFSKGFRSSSSTSSSTSSDAIVDVDMQHYNVINALYESHHHCYQYFIHNDSDRHIHRYRSTYTALQQIWSEAFVSFSRTKMHNSCFSESDDEHIKQLIESNTGTDTDNLVDCVSIKLNFHLKSNNDTDEFVYYSHNNYFKANPNQSKDACIFLQIYLYEDQHNHSSILAIYRFYHSLLMVLNELRQLHPQHVVVLFFPSVSLFPVKYRLDETELVELHHHLLVNFIMPIQGVVVIPR